jgi:hypothetical protein
MLCVHIIRRSTSGPNVITTGNRTDLYYWARASLTNSGTEIAFKHCVEGTSWLFLFAVLFTHLTLCSEIWRRVSDRRSPNCRRNVPPPYSVSETKPSKILDIVSAFLRNASDLYHTKLHHIPEHVDFYPVTFQGRQNRRTAAAVNVSQRVEWRVSEIGTQGRARQVRPVTLVGPQGLSSPNTAFFKS